MAAILFKAVPFAKEEVTLALESGVDGIIVPKANVISVAGLARCLVIAVEDMVEITLGCKNDELIAAKELGKGKLVLLTNGWEIIPVENLLAYAEKQGVKTSRDAEAMTGLALEASTLEQARLAAGILEKGVDIVVVPPKGVENIKNIVASLKYESVKTDLCQAEITEITPVGMGHRVCVDTLSVFKAGQGMLVGNSAAFTFLVNAETEANEYVASRPFRINAGAVHAYAVMPEDRTSYLEELRSGSEVLIVSHTGATETAIVGRAKVEKRPMLLIRAKTQHAEGTVFLQNAETIRLVTPEGKPVSVVSIKVGDKILCRQDVAGRHFGIRITEDIAEI